MSEITKEEVIAMLKKFVCERCLRKPGFDLEPEEPLLSSGLLRSIHLVELAVYVEKDLGVYIPDTEFNSENIDTLDSMATLVLKYRE